MAGTHLEQAQAAWNETPTNILHDLRVSSGSMGPADVLNHWRKITAFVGEQNPNLYKENHSFRWRIKS